MKILIPTAKELNVNAEKFSFKKLSNNTLKILDELLKLDVATFAKIYKIKEENAGLEKERFENIFQKTAFSYDALHLFNGLMYRNIRRDVIFEKEKAYLKANVFITSSFYGIINVYEKISAHRLDFLQNFKVDNNSLKIFWQSSYDSFVENEDVVISLLSSEFEEVFSKKYRDKFFKIVFMEEKLGEFKIHSTISKKARGKFLTAMFENNVTRVEDIKKLNFDNFSFYEELSSENKLVFVKKQK